MALKDLEQFKDELEYLAELLRFETKPVSRFVIIQRVQEIMGEIMDSTGEGFNDE